MVRKLAKDLVQYFKNISLIEYSERSHQVELVGTYFDGENKQDVVCTAQLKHYIPRDAYGEKGYFYEKVRQRKVKNKKNEWVNINETVMYYEMSEADKKFVHVSYVHHHLDQRQISKLSGIPQPYVFRYIKHNKLKPVYQKTPRSKRNIRMNLDNLVSDLNSLKELSDIAPVITAHQDINVEIPDDVDFTQNFHIDPFPTRSEWKIRRDKFGLKNGEDWRNSDYDTNPGPRQQGDGSVSRKRKASKCERKEKRRIKNIQKFNSDK